MNGADTMDMPSADAVEMDRMLSPAAAALLWGRLFAIGGASEPPPLYARQCDPWEGRGRVWPTAGPEHKERLHERRRAAAKAAKQARKAQRGRR